MDQQDRATQLHVAAATGAIAEIRTLLAAGVAVDAVDGQGVTPLAHAVARGQTEIAAIIRAAGGRMK